MSGLRDMEELISDIRDVNLKEYMREALKCYAVGSYRACIVLSFIAIFEDLYKKLEGMTNVNSDAKKIFKEISKKKNEQQIYENDLVNKLKAGKIIAEIDAEFLTILKKLRNKAAHPSGHKPSAEEARYVYSETISRFLSKPVLSTTQVADQILEKLTNQYLFISGNVKGNSEIVNDMVKNLHSDGYLYLINKLIASLENDNTSIKNNAKKFLLGLSFNPPHHNILEQIQKHLIDEFSSDQSKRQIILECISANGSLLNGLNKVTYERLNKLIDDTISTTKPTVNPIALIHPIRIVKSVLILKKPIIDKYFLTTLEKIIKQYKYSPELMKHVKEYEWVRNKLIQLFFDDAGSNDFFTANNFANAAILLDESISSLADDMNCFELIIHIYNASYNGACKSEELVDEQFNNIPKIKEKAINAIKNNSDSCQKIIEEKMEDPCKVEEFQNEYL